MINLNRGALTACASTYRTALSFSVLLLLWSQSETNAQWFEGSVSATVIAYPNSTSLRYFVLYGDAEVGSLHDLEKSPHGMPALHRYSDPSDPWLAMDKLQHVAFSFFITTGTQYGLVNKLDFSEKSALPLSVGTSALAGVSKEIVDRTRSSNPYFSYRDLVADGAGILLAVGLILI